MQSACEGECVSVLRPLISDLLPEILLYVQSFRLICSVSLPVI